VLFSAVETGGKMQIHQPGSLVPRVSLNPDSPLVLKNSRHPISEAGFDVLLTGLDQAIRPHEAGDPRGATLTYDGVTNPPDVGRPCHQITEVRANGETWVVCLDAANLMPASVRGTARDGSLLELYGFRDVELDVAELATAQAFSPDARWGGKGGSLLGRLAGQESDSARR
jgi:hypothetical protein